jgi:RNA polymerase sigma factor, sigma-70 family
MKMGLINSKQTAHAAASSVAALQAKNPTDSADSQVKSAVALSEGLEWDEEMLAAWRSARPVIASVLAGAHLLADVDDVHQETFLRVCERWDRYDPDRGPVGVWVRRIAKSAAQDYVRTCDRLWARECLDVDLLLRDKASLSAVEPGSAASEVLRMLRVAAGATDYFRAVRVALWFDGDVVAAAKAWGISGVAVRKSRVCVRRIGKVIARALVEREQRIVHGAADDPVSVATLAACLPSDTGNLAYLEALSELGSVEELSAAHLMGLTGLSHDTAKEHAARTKKLLSIARSVVETGTLAIAEKEA